MLSNHSENYPKVAFTVPETARMLSVGLTTLHKLVKTGRLKKTKIGRKSVFLASDIEAFVAELQQ